MAKRSTNPTIAMINKNFIIRWKNQGDKGSNLVSAGQYVKIVGEDLKTTHFDKVLSGGLQKYTFLIRKRLKIQFISK